MSAKYSTSPSLRLTVVKSRVGALLHGLLCLAIAFCLARLARRGYPLAAVAVLPAAVLCCWQLGRQGLAGASICWRQGDWSIERAGSCTELTLLPGSCSLPAVIYLAWTESASGLRDSAWLFPDSAPAEQLRGLRVRLTLAR